MTKIAAFFDLDRTLIDVNSALLYAKFERKHGRITTKMLIETAWTSLLYHFNMLDMESAYAKATEFYRGQEGTIRDNTRVFFEQCVEDRLQTGAKRALDGHKSLGHETVLLSTTSSFQGEVACEKWGISHRLTNEFPTQRGKLTGEFQRPLCYHAGKVERAKDWAKTHGYDLEKSYFYSDSFSDLPMLESVGKPRVVNPDPRLKRHAQRKGWPVLNWKDPKTPFSK